MVLVSSEQMFLTETRDRAVGDERQRYFGVCIPGDTDRREQKKLGNDALVVVLKIKQKLLDLHVDKMLVALVGHR